MRIIEGLKQIKDLSRKAEDIRKLITNFHADMEWETPVYGTPEQQKEQISKWLQAHRDIVKELSNLKYRIAKTNVNTKVTIKLDGVSVEKSIVEWINRRKAYATMDKLAWDALTDKGLRDSAGKTSTGDNAIYKMRRYYDPKERDAKKEFYASEPLAIDAALEIVNATTDLME